MVWGTKTNNENLVPFFELPIALDLNMGELQISQSCNFQQHMVYLYEAIFYNCIPTLPNQQQASIVTHERDIRIV